VNTSTVHLRYVSSDIVGYIFFEKDFYEAPNIEKKNPKKFVSDKLIIYSQRKTDHHQS